MKRRKSSKWPSSIFAFYKVNFHHDFSVSPIVLENHGYDFRQRLFFVAEEEHLSPPDSPSPDSKDHHNSNATTSRSYAEGYKDCFVELLQFMVDVEGFFVGEGLCSRLLNHTQNSMDRMGHDIGTNFEYSNGI